MLFLERKISKQLPSEDVFQASLENNCDQTIISRYGKNVKWDFVSRKREIRLHISRLLTNQKRESARSMG